MKKKTQKENVDAAVIIKQFQKQATPLNRQLAKLNGKIKTPEDLQRAGAAVKALKQLAKNAKQRMDDLFVDPAKTIIKNAQGFFSPFLESIAATELEWKAEINRYLTTNDNKALLLEEAVNNGRIKLSTYAKKVNELAVVGSGDVSTRTKKVLVIENVKKIPAKFLVPDEKAIKEALLKGETVPGCSLTEERVIAI